jgi:hypothetical protein
MTSALGNILRRFGKRCGSHLLAYGLKSNIGRASLSTHGSLDSTAATNHRLPKKTINPPDDNYNVYRNIEKTASFYIRSIPSSQVMH